MVIFHSGTITMHNEVHHSINNSYYHLTLTSYCVLIEPSIKKRLDMGRLIHIISSSIRPSAAVSPDQQNLDLWSSWGKYCWWQLMAYSFEILYAAFGWWVGGSGLLSISSFLAYKMADLTFHLDWMNKQFPSLHISLLRFIELWFTE